MANAKNSLDLARCKKILSKMKTLLNKATSAFEKLAKELGATLTINELGPKMKDSEISFDTLQYHTEEVYLWDRKHGMSQVKCAAGYPNLGWAILQGSVKEEVTRFSYLAIHQKADNTLKVYPATMGDVKMWRAL
jgi:hypothetical protein